MSLPSLSALDVGANHAFSRTPATHSMALVKQMVISCYDEKGKLGLITLYPTIHNLVIQDLEFTLPSPVHSPVTWWMNANSSLTCLSSSSGHTRPSRYLSKASETTEDIICRNPRIYDAAMHHHVERTSCSNATLANYKVQLQPVLRMKLDTGDAAHLVRSQHT